jgi:hypothetical protein
MKKNCDEWSRPKRVKRVGCCEYIYPRDTSVDVVIVLLLCVACYVLRVTCCVLRVACWCCLWCVLWLCVFVRLRVCMLRVASCVLRNTLCVLPCSLGECFLHFFPLFFSLFPSLLVFLCIFPLTLYALCSCTTNSKKIYVIPNLVFLFAVFVNICANLGEKVLDIFGLAAEYSFPSRVTWYLYARVLQVRIIVIRIYICTNILSIFCIWKNWYGLCGFWHFLGSSAMETRIFLIPPQQIQTLQTLKIGAQRYIKYTILYYTILYFIFHPSFSPLPQHFIRSHAIFKFKIQILLIFYEANPCNTSSPYSY